MELLLKNKFQSARSNLYGHFIETTLIPEYQPSLVVSQPISTVNLADRRFLSLLRQILFTD